MSKILYGILSILIFQNFLFLMLSSFAPAQPGSSAPAFVLDIAGGTNNIGALFSMDPENGQRTLVSDFGDSSQGPLGVQPISLTQEDTDLILVVDMDFGNLESGALFQVTLPSGDRQIISDFSNTDQGPLGFHPTGVAFLNDNSALVVSTNIENNLFGGIFSVNVLTGERTVVSDFNNMDQGPPLNEPFGIAVINSNTALVMDATNNALSASALFSVNLNNGNRTVLSNFGDATQGPTGSFLRHVTIGNPGEALATDLQDGILFSIDTSTGDRTVISNTSAVMEGVALENDQSALVVNDLGGTSLDDIGTLLRIDLSTGTSEIVSDFGDDSQGVLGSMPFGVIVLSENPSPVPPGPDNSNGNNSCALSTVSSSDGKNFGIDIGIMLLPLLLIALRLKRKRAAF